MDGVSKGSGVRFARVVPWVLACSELACTSGKVDGGEALATTRQEVVLGADGHQTIAGVHWYRANIGPHAGSASYDGTRFTVRSKGLGAAYQGWQDPNPPDTLHFVYTPVVGDVEIVARVTSLQKEQASPEGQAQVGVMIRGDDEGEATPIDALSMMAPMGAGFFSLGSPFSGTCTAGAEMSSLGSTFRARPIAGAAPVLGRTFQGDTRNAPPNLWLRLQRVGDDFSISRSLDGQNWISGPGGKFTAQNAYVGFYASREHTVGADEETIATFEEVYVGKPRLDYTSTWVGSTFASASKGFLRREMQGFHVAPDGRSYKYTNNVMDGTQHESIAAFNATGELAASANPEIDGIPQGGIAGDGAQLYYATLASKIQERNRETLALERTLTFTPALGTIAGIAARDGKLYVSDFGNQKIRILNLATGAESGFDFTNPGILAVDGSGRIWVVRNSAGPPAVPLPGSVTSDVFPSNLDLTVECHELGGAPCGSLDLAPGVNPTALAFPPGSASEPLLIADNGPNQNVLVCTGLAGTPDCDGFGVLNGAFAGPTAGITEVEPSAPPRFFSLRGVGVDGTGNVYVASGAPRVDIRKFSGGTEQWAVQGYSPEPGAFDPESEGDELDFYTTTRHLKFDASKHGPGEEWAPHAVTWSPFGSHATQDRWRFNWTAPGFISAPWIRNLGMPNARFLFVSLADFEVGPDFPNQRIQIFRFDGEVAKVCGHVDWYRDGTRRLRVWIDSPANPNGTIEPAEEQVLPMPGLWGNFGMDVDTNGDIWLSFPQTASDPPQRILRLRLDHVAGGVPVYDLLEGLDEHGLPDPGVMAYIPRYDAENQRLHLLASVAPTLEHECQAVSAPTTAIVTYEGWPNSPQESQRAPLPSPITTHNQPEDFSFPFYDELCGCEPPSCSCGTDGFRYVSFDVAGDMFFVQEHAGTVRALAMDSGREVGRFFAGPEVSGLQALALDRDHMRAFRRSNGEYLITVNDSSDSLARTMLFRWTPRWTPKHLDPIVWYSAGSEYIGDADDPGNDAPTRVMQWRDRSGNERHVVQTLAGNRPGFERLGWNGEKPALMFDGTNSYLYSSTWGSSPPNGSEAPYTVLAVVEPTLPKQAGIASWYGTYGGGWVSAQLAWNGSELRPESLRYGASGGPQRFTSSFDAGTGKHLLAYRYDGAGTFEITMDESTVTSSTFATLPPVGATEMPFLVGWADSLNNHRFAGKLAELIVVDRALSDDEVDAYRTYVEEEWGFGDAGALGDPCEQPRDCQSGFCVDGICCQSACTTDNSCLHLGCGNFEDAPGTCEGYIDPDGTPCEDGNPATSGEQCQSGECVGAWSPEGLDGVVAWYFASAEHVLTVNGAVTQWSDRSGNGRHVLQTASSMRPTYWSTGWNGKPTVNFNGTTAFLRNDSWNSTVPNGNELPYTILSVVQASNVQNGSIASWYSSLGGGWVANRLVVSGGALRPNMRRQGWNQDSQNFTSVFDLGMTRHVLVYRYDGDGTLKITVDGVTSSSTSSPVSPVAGAEFLLGRDDTYYNHTFAGNISELILVDRELGDEEIAGYREYAQTQWTGL